MKKFDEFSDPKSCFNKANNDELLFVLLARDKSAPVAIRAWIHHRLISGKNVATDATIIEARKTADEMERYQARGNQVYRTSMEK
jgi:hypothetical protein